MVRELQQKAMTEVLGWKAHTSLDRGLRSMSDWVATIDDEAVRAYHQARSS